jgi:flagellar biosynthesis anti-sigma factor FlgM
MKIDDPKLASVAAPPATASRAKDAERSTPPGSAGSNDDVHLSELVRSLRSLAVDSPERQARLEQLARSVADGSYQVDAQATASKMVDEALNS